MAETRALQLHNLNYFFLTSSDFHMDLTVPVIPSPARFTFKSPRREMTVIAASPMRAAPRAGLGT